MPTDENMIRNAANGYDEPGEEEKRNLFFKLVPEYRSQGYTLEGAMDAAHAKIAGKNVRPPLSKSIREQVNGLTANSNTNKENLVRALEGMRTKTDQETFLVRYKALRNQGKTHRNAVNELFHQSQRNANKNEANMDAFVEGLHGMQPKERQRALQIFLSRKGTYGYKELVKKFNKESAMGKLINGLYEELAGKVASRGRSLNSNAFITAKTANVLETVKKAQNKGNQLRAAAAQQRLFFRAQIIEANRLKVSGDGNCLFTSVAQALHYRQTGMFIQNRDVLHARQLELRKRVSEYICNNPRLKELGDCTAMLNNGTYGGEPEIEALAMVTRIPIMIFKSAGRNGKYYQRHAFNGVGIVYGGQFNSTEPIYLVYTPGSTQDDNDAHYDYLYNPIVDSKYVMPRIAFVPPINGPKTRVNSRQQAQQAQQQPTIPIFAGGNKRRESMGNGIARSSGLGGGFDSWFSGKWGSDLSGASWILMAITCVSSSIALAAR